MLWGRLTSRAVGKTNVDVTMKNMSNRKMTSVIDAIENVAVMLCDRLRAIRRVR